MTPSLEGSAPQLVGLLLSGLVVLYGWPAAHGFREWIDRRLLGTVRAVPVIRWDWRFVALVVGGVFVIAAFVQSTPIACSAGEDDTLALLQSGRNLLAGGNPFVTAQCGHDVLVPYGLAGAGLDALGNFAGRAGIWLVWGLLALLMVPLTWALAARYRGYATVFVATSMLYAPLVVGSIQGGHSAIVPVTALLGVWLALRGNRAAGTLVGFLSTVKFPSLFPFWGSLSGVARGRWFALVLSVAVFVGSSALVVAVWGGGAYDLLFSSQLSRSDFSINEFGVLIPLGAMPPTTVLTLLQGLSLLAAIAFVHVRRWPAVPSMALLTVVVALVAQRFTENFLIWLLPVALLGPVYTRWLFAIGILGVLDGTVAIPMCTAQGACALSESLGGIVGVLLLLLLVMILREGPRSVENVPRAIPEATSPVGVPASPSGDPPATFHSAPRLDGVADRDPLSWSGPLATPPPSG